MKLFTHNYLELQFILFAIISTVTNCAINMKKTTTTLVLGATGATGKRVVEQLLEKDQNVRAIVRSKERMLQLVKEHPNLSITESTLLDMSDEEVQARLKGCDAVVSCLGHNLTFKGMYGKPRRLVTDTIARVYKAVNEIEPSSEIKFILMGSNGVANPDGSDNKRPFKERMILSLIRTLVPPHVDNEKAAAFVSHDIDKNNPYMKWVVVRPDDLIEGDVSSYELFPKPQKGLFGGGVATRANVAHFMVDLILNDQAWEAWKFQMPVIMNKE